jgi:hypothetical protein
VSPKLLDKQFQRTLPSRSLDGGNAEPQSGLGIVAKAISRLARIDPPISQRCLGTNAGVATTREFTERLTPVFCATWARLLALLASCPKARGFGRGVPRVIGSTDWDRMGTFVLMCFPYRGPQGLTKAYCLRPRDEFFNSRRIKLRLARKPCHLRLFNELRPPVML